MTKEKTVLAWKQHSAYCATILIKDIPDLCSEKDICFSKDAHFARNTELANPL